MNERTLVAKERIDTEPDDCRHGEEASDVCPVPRETEVNGEVATFLPSISVISVMPFFSRVKKAWGAWLKIL